MTLEKDFKSSALSVNGMTFTSPRMPCGFKIVATVRYFCIDFTPFYCRAPVKYAYMAARNCVIL